MGLVSAALTEISRLLELMKLKLTWKLSISSPTLNLNWRISVVDVRFLGHDDGSLVVVIIRLSSVLLVRWHHFLREGPLLRQVLEFDVNQAQLLWRKAECFSVGKSLDSCKLIQ